MASNNPPEIPSFKKADKDKEPKGGGAPPLGAGNSGGLRIRGLSGGPKTIIERLKQFKKKDLIFIASGLGVLFLAPLAEHFMMNPNADQSVLREGFDRKGNMFGDLSPYEGGSGGAAPGGMVGSGSDVITPLNVRDPSALVMGPGAAQQPPPSGSSGSVAPPPAPSTSAGGGWKDALAEGAKGAAHAASPSAFKAPGNLAGAIRGLSALSGGSYGGGPSYSLPPISASNVPNHGGGRGSLAGVQAPAGYKGVAPRSNTSGGGSADALRAAADRAGNLFNRAGSAANNLDTAAKEAIPTGGAGAGGGGAGGGAADKGPGGSSSKDNKALGESLAYLIAKQRAEKELDLEFSKKKWRQFEFPKMLIEETAKLGITNILGKGLFEPVGKAMGGYIDCTLHPETCVAGKSLECISADGSINAYTIDDKNNWQCDQCPGPSCQAVNYSAGGGGQKVPCPRGCGYKGGPGSGTTAAATPPTLTAPTSVPAADTINTARAAEQQKIEDALKANCPEGKPVQSVSPAYCVTLLNFDNAWKLMAGITTNVKSADAQLTISWTNMDLALSNVSWGLATMDKARRHFGCQAQEQGCTADDAEFNRGAQAYAKWDAATKADADANDKALVGAYLQAAQRNYGRALTVINSGIDPDNKGLSTNKDGAATAQAAANSALTNALGFTNQGWSVLANVNMSLDAARTAQAGDTGAGKPAVSAYENNLQTMSGTVAAYRKELIRLSGDPTDAVLKFPDASDPTVATTPPTLDPKSTDKAKGGQLAETRGAFTQVEGTRARTFDLKISPLISVQDMPVDAYSFVTNLNTQAKAITNISTDPLKAPEKTQLAEILKNLGSDDQTTLGTNRGALSLRDTVTSVQNNSALPAIKTVEGGATTYGFTPSKKSSSANAGQK